MLQPCFTAIVLLDFEYFGEKLLEFSGCKAGDQIRDWSLDGDLALIKGLKQGNFLFANVPHIRCERHMQQNVKKKLKELGGLSNPSRVAWICACLSDS